MPESAFKSQMETSGLQLSTLQRTYLSYQESIKAAVCF